MNLIFSHLSRRRFLQGGVAAGTFGAMGLLTPEMFAEELLRTPPLTEGPFYPDKIPLDKDNDLIIVGSNTVQAVGDITHLTGRILDVSGTPIKDASIEIWQCDANQVYLNSRDSMPKAKQRDQNFQGYGTFTTGAKGEYRFRTIKPVAYPGRPAPHIHFRVNRGGREILTTQLFIRGHAGNARDGVYGGIRDVLDRELVQVDFKPVKDSKIGEFAASFDVVLGKTPDEKAFKGG